MSGLAIIGGTGVDQWEGLQVVAEHSIDTPFGSPSRPVQEGRLGETTVYFLQRHGHPEAIPPHLINYRANLWALHSLAVDGVVAINTVGGITEEMRPGRLLIPDQVIDYTWGREHTIDDGSSGSLLHVDFTEPYDRELRMALVDAAVTTGGWVIPEEEWLDMQVELGDWGPMVQELLADLDELPDVTLVEVEDGDTHVRVFKENGSIKVSVRDEEINVKVSLPMRSARRTLSKVASFI